MNEPTPEHERALRETLHRAAADVTPRQGFADVEARSARGAATQTWARAGLVSAAAAVVVILALVVPGLVGGDDDVDVVTSTPTTTTEPSSDTTTGSGQTTTTAAPTSPDQDLVVGVWPFATAADADAWSGPSAADPWDYTDPVDTARSFLAWVGADTLEVGEFLLGDARSGEIVATEPLSGRESYLFLRRVGASDTWTVIGAEARYLIIERPETGDLVEIGRSEGSMASIPVAGSVEAFEGTVVVELRTLAGGVIDLVPGIGGTMGTMGVFEVDLDAGDASLGPAVVVATTSSPRDGSIEQVAAVAVDLVEG